LKKEVNEMPTETPPKAHTYKLILQPYTDTDKPMGKSEKTTAKRKTFKVQIPTNSFWKGVRKGDVVQFIPDPKLKGASVEVRFAPSVASGTLPLKVTRIQSTSFHKVVSNTRRFSAMCYVKTSSGDKWGGYDEGKKPCTGPGC
jgi:hypothetical protein